MAVTPARSVRVPDAVWDAATARAKLEETTVTAVVMAALTKYAKGGAARAVAPPASGPEGER